MGYAQKVPRIALSVPPDRPLDTLPPSIPDHYGIPTLGWYVLDWALPRFHQPNGPLAGDPFKPTPRQVRFLLWFYALDEHGKFIFRHAVRRLAKGSGKARGPHFSHSASCAARSGSCGGSRTLPVVLSAG